MGTVNSSENLFYPINAQNDITLTATDDANVYTLTYNIKEDKPSGTNLSIGICIPKVKDKDSGAYTGGLSEALKLTVDKIEVE